MAAVDIKKADGGAAGSVELDAAIFGVQPNVPLMHQVVTAQLAARRSGTQSTLTRSEVRGGGRKPWKQKGTGRARQGSTRAPHWVGGGVTHAPKPRSYAQKTPKKMIQAALRSALSDRATEGKILIVDTWGDDFAKTKQAKALLTTLRATGNVLVVVGYDEVEVAKAFRNLPEVHVILDTELNAYDVLCSDVVLFSRATLPSTATTDAPADSATTDAPAEEETK